MSGLFADRAKARALVLRLNDHPHGLTSHVHPLVVRRLERDISGGLFEEIWAASPPLEAYARQLNPRVPIAHFPNGVLLESFEEIEESGGREPRSIAYLGAFNDWFDSDLVAATADRLSTWRFHLIGPRSRRIEALARRPNVTYCGAVRFEDVARVLSHYRVGIIPFRGSEKMLDGIDPLKAYQYLASGLGIASTPTGRLQEALAGVAHFGQDPESFAGAVVRADSDCGLLRRRPDVRELLQSVSWNRIVDSMEGRLEDILSRERGPRRRDRLVAT